ncbi:MAG: hypothetical protein JWP92_1989 [Caulobacter sp.]|nr:hypothetical protein [Caulobacter sp.]
MIRSVQGQTESLVFYKTPNRRQRVARSRLMAVVIIAAVAASAGVIEQFHARSASATTSSSGPATYFPR